MTHNNLKGETPVPGLKFQNLGPIEGKKGPGKDSGRIYDVLEQGFHYLDYAKMCYAKEDRRDLEKDTELCLIFLTKTDHEEGDSTPPSKFQDPGPEYSWMPHPTTTATSGGNLEVQQEPARTQWSTG